MADEIPDLWPNEINIAVLPPVAVLKTQAAIIAQKTKGLVTGRVETATDGGELHHELDLVAPVLSYRHRILDIKHERELLYPVEIEAECFAVNGSAVKWMAANGRSYGTQKAATNGEF